jgi:hypothetical protein
MTGAKIYNAMSQTMLLRLSRRWLFFLTHNALNTKIIRHFQLFLKYVWTKFQNNATNAQNLSPRNLQPNQWVINPTRRFGTNQVEEHIHSPGGRCLLADCCCWCARLLSGALSAHGTLILCGWRETSTEVGIKAAAAAVSALELTFSCVCR